LCPKGAALVDFVHSPNRLKYPEVRRPGSDKWERLSWDDAITQIAKHMKADRDANFIEELPDGKVVNRWPSLAVVGSSAVNNEAGYLLSKVSRGMGVVALETQARI
jgi:formate dehydrogenase major subunit